MPEDCLLRPRRPLMESPGRAAVESAPLAAAMRNLAVAEAARVAIRVLPLAAHRCSRGRAAEAEAAGIRAAPCTMVAPAALPILTLRVAALLRAMSALPALPDRRIRVGTSRRLALAAAAALVAQRAGTYPTAATAAWEQEAGVAVRA